MPNDTEIIAQPQRLKSSDRFTLAHARAKGDDDNAQDVLLVRSRTSNPKALISMLDANGMQSDMLMRAKDGSDGWLASVHLALNQMKLLLDEPKNAIRPFAKFAESSPSLSTAELLDLAAKHLPAREIESQTVQRPEPKVTEKKSAEVRPLAAYSQELANAGIQFQRKRNFDGGYSYYVFLQGESSDLVNSLADANQCSPPVNFSRIKKNDRTMNEGLARQHCYQLSGDNFNRLHGLINKELLQDESFTFKPRLFTSAKSYDAEGKNKPFDTKIDRLIVTPDPEDSSKSLLYVVASAVRERDVLRAHARLDEFNKALSVNFAQRITVKGQDFPAIERIRISRDVGIDILAQAEELNSHTKIEPMNEDAISLEQLDALVKEKCKVQQHISAPVVEIKAPPKEKTADERAALQKVQAARLIEGLKQLRKAHIERDIDPPLLVQALVRDSDGKQHREIIATVTHSELLELQKANILEQEDGQAHAFLKGNDWEEISIKGGNGDKLLRIRVAMPLLQYQDIASRAEFSPPYLTQGEGVSDLLQPAYANKASFVAAAQSYMQKRVERINAGQESALSDDEKAFQKIIGRGMRLVQVQHPSEAEFNALGELLTTLKNDKRQMSHYTACFEGTAETAKKAMDFSGIISGMPEAMRDISDRAAKIAKDIQALERLMAPWNNITQDNAAFARMQPKRQSSVIVALEISSDETLAMIGKLWKPSGNQPYLLRPPEINRHAVNGKHVVLLFPTDEMLHDMKAFDTRQTQQNLSAAGYGEAEAAAELQLQLSKRWQSMNQQPVHAFKLMEHLNAALSNKKQTLWERLEDQFNTPRNKLDADAIRALVHGLIAEGGLGEQVESLLQNSKTAAAIKDELHFAREALKAHLAAEQTELLSVGLATTLRTVEGSLIDLKPLLVAERYDPPEVDKQTMRTAEIVASGEKIGQQSALVVSLQDSRDVAAFQKIYAALDEAGALLKPKHYGDLIAYEPELTKEQQQAKIAVQTIAMVDLLITACGHIAYDLANGDITSLLERLDKHSIKFTQYNFYQHLVDGAKPFPPIDFKAIRAGDESAIAALKNDIEALQSDLRTKLLPHFRRIAHSVELPDLESEYKTWEIVTGDSPITDLQGNAMTIEEAVQPDSALSHTDRIASQRKPRCVKLYLTKEAGELLTEMAKESNLTLNGKINQMIAAHNRGRGKDKANSIDSEILERAMRPQALADLIEQLNPFAPSRGVY